MITELRKKLNHSEKERVEKIATSNVEVCMHNIWYFTVFPLL